MKLGILGAMAFGMALAACGSSSAVETPSKAALDLFQKGKAAYLKQDLTTAEQCFADAAKEQSGFVNALVMLGKTRYFLGKPDAARKDLEKALGLSRSHVEALYYLARVAVLKKESAKAQEYLNAILDVDPANARANYALGTLLAESKEYQKSFLHFNAALEEEAMLARVRLQFARELVRAGLKDRARTVLEPALTFAAPAALAAEIRALAKDLK